MHSEVIKLKESGIKIGPTWAHAIGLDSSIDPYEVMLSDLTPIAVKKESRLKHFN